MLYAIGNKEKYDKIFSMAEETGDYPVKFGRTGTHKGGSVFEDQEGAKARIKALGLQETHIVLGVEASLKDTYNDNGLLRLTRTAVIKRLGQ